MNHAFAKLLVVFTILYPADAAVLANEASRNFSGCVADLNGDGRQDTALIVDDGSTKQLVVLLKEATSYRAQIAFTFPEPLALACESATSIQETAVSKHGARDFKVPGAYAKLSQPEGAVIAVFWDGTKFQEVWLAD